MMKKLSELRASPVGGAEKKFTYIRAPWECNNSIEIFTGNGLFFLIKKETF
jgi:hypothetical protein